MSTVIAYLDAGTGSQIAALVAGGFAAFAVTAKMYWHRILVFLHHPQARGRDRDRRGRRRSEHQVASGRGGRTACDLPASYASVRAAPGGPLNASGLRPETSE